MYFKGLFGNMLNFVYINKARGLVCFYGYNGRYGVCSSRTTHCYHPERIAKRQVPFIDVIEADVCYGILELS